MKFVINRSLNERKSVNTRGLLTKAWIHCPRFRLPSPSPAWIFRHVGAIGTNLLQNGSIMECGDFQLAALALPEVITIKKWY